MALLEFILIKKDSPEWNYMWEWVETHPINEGLLIPSIALNPLNDFAWQYTGTLKYDDRLVHEFHHKSHPKNNERIELAVSASENFNPETDIEKIIQLK